MVFIIAYFSMIMTCGFLFFFNNWRIMVASLYIRFLYLYINFKNQPGDNNCLMEIDLGYYEAIIIIFLKIPTLENFLLI